MSTDYLTLANKQSKYGATLSQPDAPKFPKFPRLKDFGYDKDKWRAAVADRKAKMEQTNREMGFDVKPEMTHTRIAAPVDDYSQTLQDMTIAERFKAGMGRRAAHLANALGVPIAVGDKAQDRDLLQTEAGGAGDVAGDVMLSSLAGNVAAPLSRVASAVAGRTAPVPLVGKYTAGAGNALQTFPGQAGVQSAAAAAAAEPGMDAERVGLAGVVGAGLGYAGRGLGRALSSGLAPDSAKTQAYRVETGAPSVREPFIPVAQSAEKGVIPWMYRFGRNNLGGGAMRKQGNKFADWDQRQFIENATPPWARGTHVKRDPDDLGKTWEDLTKFYGTSADAPAYSFLNNTKYKISQLSPTTLAALDSKGFLKQVDGVTPFPTGHQLQRLKGMLEKDVQTAFNPSGTRSADEVKLIKAAVESDLRRGLPQEELTKYLQTSNSYQKYLTALEARAAAEDATPEASQLLNVAKKIAGKKKASQTTESGMGPLLWDRTLAKNVVGDRFNDLSVSDLLRGAALRRDVANAANAIAPIAPSGVQRTVASPLSLVTNLVGGTKAVQNVVAGRTRPQQMVSSALRKPLVDAAAREVLMNEIRTVPTEGGY